MTDKYRVLLIAVLVILFSTSFFAQKQSASEVVKSFYKYHRSNSDIFNRREVDFRKKWLSPNFYRLFLYELKREKEYLKQNPNNKPYFGEGFGINPLDECTVNEKISLNWYLIDKSLIKNNNATVTVKFYSPKKCGNELLATYQVELVKIKSKWLINDLVYSDGTRLTKDLKRDNY